MDLTDEQLKRELLENNKSQTEIAEQYNLSISVINERVRDLGIIKLGKVNNQGGRQYAYIRNELKKLGYDPEEDLYLDSSIEDGKIVLDVYNVRWKQKSGFSKQNSKGG